MTENVQCIKKGGHEGEQNCSYLQSSTSTDDLFTSSPFQFSEVVSAEFRDMFQYVVDLWFCSILSYVCIVVNIITIVVFAKMGFKETMNISLTAIAVWDIIKSVCVAIMKLYGPIQLASEILAYNWNSVTMITVGYFYSIAGYVSGVMAAFVATERCLCVSLPFTVKLLLTRKVAIVVNVIISLCVVASYVVVYVEYTFKEIIDPTINQTVILFFFSKLHYTYPHIRHYIEIISLLYPFLCFVVICFCSAVTVYHLRQASKSKILSSSASATSSDKKPKQPSSRDAQVTKMLLVVIAVYIGSYIPRICHYVAMSTVPGYIAIHGTYVNVFWVVTYIMIASDIINAAANPFILFFMSSQFRNTLIGMFCLPDVK